MHQQIDPMALTIHGIVAFIGGLARALSDHKKAILDIFVATLIAGFTGTLFGMLAIHFIGDGFPYLTLSISGAGGLMGEKGMYYFLKIIKRTIEANLK